MARHGGTFARMFRCVWLTPISFSAVVAGQCGAFGRRSCAEGNVDRERCLRWVVVADDACNDIATRNIGRPARQLAPGDAPFLSLVTNAGFPAAADATLQRPLPVWPNAGKSGTLSLDRWLTLGRASGSRPEAGFGDEGRTWTAGCRHQLRGNLVLNRYPERFSGHVSCGSPGRG